jgi:hypothetical protein
MANIKDPNVAPNTPKEAEAEPQLNAVLVTLAGTQQFCVLKVKTGPTMWEDAATYVESFQQQIHERGLDLVTVEVAKPDGDRARVALGIAHITCVEPMYVDLEAVARAAAQAKRNAEAMEQRARAQALGINPANARKLS